MMTEGSFSQSNCSSSVIAALLLVVNCRLPPTRLRAALWE